MLDALLDSLQPLSDISATELVAAVAVVLFGFLGRALILAVTARLARAASGRRSAFDDIFIQSLAAPAGWAVVLGSVYLAVYVLPIPPGSLLDVTLTLAARVGSMVLLVWFGLRFTDRVCDFWQRGAADATPRVESQAIPMVRKILRVLVVLIGGAFLLQNLGYSVGGILAGLGLGGAAIALAAKDSLANLFGALVVFWDRPFEVGDWVRIGDAEGEVEEVGMRSTRIRTLSTTLVTVPNAELMNLAITNWSRLRKRVVDFSFSVTYDTPPEKLEAALDAIRKLILESDRFHHDSVHVRLSTLGDSGFGIMVLCWTVTTEYGEYLAVREQFLLDIARILNDLGVRFALPARSVHVEK